MIKPFILLTRFVKLTWSGKALLTPLLLLFFLLSNSVIQAQISDGDEGEVWDYCATSAIEQELMKDSAFAASVQQMEAEIRNKTIKLENGEGNVLDDPIVIPVVFHIVHYAADDVPGVGSNLSDDRVYAALNHLNKAFANEVFSEISEVTNISFCLADKNSLGTPSSGITRYADWFTDYFQSLHEDISLPPNSQSMKAVTAPTNEWSRYDYLNIWIVNNICVTGPPGCAAIGHAYLAGSHGAWWDGVIIENEYFGNTIENDRALIHEVGHYLNLKHTFEPGPSGNSCFNQNCLVDNDCVCDTDPDDQGSPGCFTSFPCPTSPVPGPLYNYMDYNDLFCEELFTLGQTNRMRLSILDDGPRASLLNSPGCCENIEVDAFFTYTSSGYEVTFDASNSTGNIASDGYVWDFGNGDVISSGSIYTYEYTDPGIYQVNLTVIPADNSGCISTYSIDVNVCNYDFIPEFTYEILDDNSVIFTAEESGLSSYTWEFGDGQFDASNSSVVSHNYQVGGYVACLETGALEDPLCVDKVCKWININRCPSLDPCHHICNGDFNNNAPIATNFYSQNMFQSWGIGSTYKSGSVDNFFELNNPTNTLVGWGNWELVGGSSEMFYHPLDPPLEPGCEATITFEAAVEYPGQSLRVFGFSGDPCGSSTVFAPECNSIPSNICPSAFQFCIVDIPSSELAVQDFTISPGLGLDDPNYPYEQNITVRLGGIDFSITNGALFLNWIDFNTPLAQQSITWTNNTGMPMDYIVIYMNPDTDPAIENAQIAVIDNLSITSNCTNPAFAYQNEDCSTLVYFTPTGSSEDHSWTFVDAAGTTLGQSTLENPSWDFISSGIYSITHSVTDECGNVATETQEIEIDDCTPPTSCHCDDPNRTNYNIDAGDGTTISSLGLPDLSYACISISGKLIIDQVGGSNIHEWDDVIAYMHPGSEIEVLNENRFYTSNNTIIQGCTHMWKGISLGNDKSRLKMENTTIRDAQFAVKVQDGSTITLNENIFIANYVGVYAAPSPNLCQEFKVLDWDTGNGAWNKNIFQHGDAPLLPAYGQEQFPFHGEIAYAGLWLNDVCGLDRIFHDDNPNTFEGLHYGILLDRVDDSRIRGVEILNLYENSIPLSDGNIAIKMTDSEDVEIRYCNLGNCHDLSDPNPCEERLYYGIWGVNSGGVIYKNGISTTSTAIQFENVFNKDLEIIKNFNISSYTAIRVNSFDNAGTEKIRILENEDVFAHTAIDFVGIHSDNVELKKNVLNIDWTTGVAAPVGMIISFSDGELIIEDNEINFDGDPNVFNGGVGIVLFNTEDCYVKENVVNGNAPGENTIHIFDGISLNASANNSLCCNKVDKSTYGVHFRNNCLPTNFNNTDFNNHNVGLYLQFAQIGLQDNTGNNWGSNSNTDAWYYGDLNLIDDSHFNSADGLIDIDKINVSGGQASDWFDITGSGADCDNDCSIANLPGDLLTGTNSKLTAWDLTTANRKKAADPIAKNSNWEAKRNLYKKLRKNPELIALDYSMSDFYSQANNNSISDLYRIQEGIKTIGKTGTSNTNYWSLKATRQTINKNLDGLWASWEAGTSSEKKSLEMEIELLHNTLKPVINELKNLDRQLNERRLEAIKSLEVDNNAIDVNEVFEINEQQTNHIYLNTIAVGNFEFSEEEKATINVIAKQCPFVGGPSVYMARTMQRFYAAVAYDDEAICRLAMDRSEGEEIDNNVSKEGFVTIFPNPIKDRFTIELSFPLEHESQLAIYDPRGKKVLAHQLAANQTQYHIESIDLLGGIYFYEINEGDRINLFSGKLVILN